MDSAVSNGKPARYLGVRLVATIVLALSLAAGLQSFPAQAQNTCVHLDRLLPGYPEGGAPYGVTSNGARTLDEHAALFFDPTEAAQLLADWGWQANVYRVFKAGDPTDPETVRPYLQVGVTCFASDDGAAAALPYVVQNLRPRDAHREIPLPSPVGDEARQFVTDVDGGIDLTLLVQSGPLLIGISTLLTGEEPIFDAVRTAQSIIALQQSSLPVNNSAETEPDLALAQLLDALPSDLPPCLVLVQDESLDDADMSTRFPGVVDAQVRLQEWGWQAAWHRQYTCVPLPASGVNWLDMSVHRFRDAAAASDAVPYFAQARTVGTQLAPMPAMALGAGATAAIAGPSENGTEYTLYLSTGPLLFRVSAIEAGAAPQFDVEAVMTALYLHVRDAQLGHPAVEEELPHPVPPTPIAQALPTPTLLPAPTNAPQVAPAENCDPSYPGVCIPPVSAVGDLDCKDVPYGRFHVLPPDPHHFDGPYDGSVPGEPDGLGCEWN